MVKNAQVALAWSTFQAGQHEEAFLLAQHIVLHAPTLHVGEWSQLVEIFLQTGHPVEAEQLAKQVHHSLSSDILIDDIEHDPTLTAPGGYSLERAQAVYGEAFRLCFEYLYNAGPLGCLVEFGTFKGFTARQMALLIREFKVDWSLYLFDSFKGFPSLTSPIDQQSYEVLDKHAWLPGHMRLAPNMPDLIRKALAGILPLSQIHLIAGFFEDTLPQQLPREPIALLHIDCDLYESTRFVLEQCYQAKLLQDGCVILFDDYNCNRANPKLGERRAFDEFLAWQTRFVASPFFSYGWSGQGFFLHDTHLILT